MSEVNIKKENQTKTNQDEASCGGLLSIFVHYSCFKYQTLIIRKINKEFLKWTPCTVLNCADMLLYLWHSVITVFGCCFY